MRKNDSCQNRNALKSRGEKRILQVDLPKSSEISNGITPFSQRKISALIASLFLFAVLSMIIFAVLSVTKMSPSITKFLPLRAMDISKSINCWLVTTYSKSSDHGRLVPRVTNL